jgi:hypothetical protein
MAFGTHHLAGRLVAARTIAYFQGAILAYVGLNVLAIDLIGGSGSSSQFSGMVSRSTVTGKGALGFALVFFVIAVVVILTEGRAATHLGDARVVLAVVETALAVYMIGFVSDGVGGWLFGPACAVAVLVLHYVPELRAYFFADDTTTATPPPPVPAASVVDPPAPPAPPALEPPAPPPAPDTDGMASPPL